MSGAKKRSRISDQLLSIDDDSINEYFKPTTPPSASKKLRLTERQKEVLSEKRDRLPFLDEDSQQSNSMSILNRKLPPEFVLDTQTDSENQREIDDNISKGRISNPPNFQRLSPMKEKVINSITTSNPTDFSTVGDVKSPKLCTSDAQPQDFDTEKEPTPPLIAVPVLTTPVPCQPCGSPSNPEPSTPKNPQSILRNSETPKSSKRLNRVSFNMGNAEPRMRTYRNIGEPRPDCICPELADCPDPITSLCMKLAFRKQGLKLDNLLKKSNVWTVGDFSRLIPSELNKIPAIKEPKLDNALNYLKAYKQQERPQPLKEPEAEADNQIITDSGDTVQEGEVMDVSNNGESSLHNLQYDSLEVSESQMARILDASVCEPLSITITKSPEKEEMNNVVGVLNFQKDGDDAMESKTESARRPEKAVVMNESDDFYDDSVLNGLVLPERPRAPTPNTAKGNGKNDINQSLDEPSVSEDLSNFANAMKSIQLVDTSKFVLMDSFKLLMDKVELLSSKVDKLVEPARVAEVNLSICEQLRAVRARFIQGGSVDDCPEVFSTLCDFLRDVNTIQQKQL